MSEGIEGNEDFLSEQTAKLLGQDDIFSIAVIRNQFENRDKQFSELQEKGLPYDLRMYMTMVGFQVVVNHRGEVMEVKQPAVTNGDEE
jgi:thiamine pyrophosphokinase